MEQGNLKIDKEFSNLIPPLIPEEFIGLEESIKEEGCRDPLIIWNDIVIDGHNRFIICNKYNIPFRIIQREFKDKNEVMLWIINNQLSRRNLNKSQKTIMGLEYKKIYARLYPQGKHQVEIFPPEKARDRAGKVVGVSGRYIDDAEIIEKKKPEAIEEIKAGNKTISEVIKEIKQEERKEKQKELEKNPLKIPEGKYSIIYADVPWSYEDKALAGDRGAGCKYPTMELEEIKSLPINNLTAENCILFLWVTMPKLNECFEVIKSWGFEYKTCGFVWIKKNKKSNTNFWGMGRWTRANAELCLIATKGNPQRKSASISQIIESPIEIHSKKPDIVRDKIVELVGDLPRIELFARQKVKGWNYYGNEIIK